MKFATTVLSLVGSAALAQAASFTFWTLDDKVRTIKFTSNENAWSVPSVTVSNAEKTTVTVPDNFAGMFYAIEEGAPDVVGMLGEVQFGGWNGATYFDVSGIDTKTDYNSVKQMWPKEALGPVAGCDVFPCNYFYVNPPDKQTWVTEEVDIMVSLGDGDLPITLRHDLNPIPF